MSNASLKEQLQAVAPQFNEKKVNQPAKQKYRQVEKPKKPKPRWLDYAQYGVELLKVYFPKSFTSSDIKPLQKGIKQELVIRLSTLESIAIEDKACMVKSLAYYVNTAYYHKSVVKGAIRVDLDGNPAGEVTEEEASYSTERFQAKQQAKVQAKQQAVSAASVASKDTATPK